MRQLHVKPYKTKMTCEIVNTAMPLSFWTDRSGQTVQNQIRLLQEEQSDQGLHCLLFHLHHFDKIPFRICLNFR